MPHKSISYKTHIVLYFVLFYILFFDVDKSHEIKKVIVMIFAGRKKYLEILMKYLMHLMKNKKINEIHFWQFTNDNYDIEYLDSISNIHKTSRNFLEYRNIFPLIKDNSFEINIKSNNGGGILLINNKYEIIINLWNNLENYIKLNASNANFDVKMNYNYTEYNFIIKIVEYNILINFKDKLLIKCKIDENIFTSIKVHSLNNSEILWDYKESINKGIKLFDTTFRKKTGHWYESYEFYLDYDFNILIKMDDDISFIDVNRFDEFINFIHLFKKNITIPNLVNHALSLYYNIKYGLVPNFILDEIYQNKSSSSDIGIYFQDGHQGKKIHQYFLDNIVRFTNNDLKPIKLDGERPSICMFGISKESYNKVYAKNMVYYNLAGLEYKQFLFEDEIYTNHLLNNYIYPRFVCIHYAFGPQRSNGLDESFIEKYKKLPNDFFNIK